MKPTMLSVDYDFFLWRGLEAEESKITVHPGTDKEQSISSMWLFDWGHSEHRSAVYQSLIWQTRWAGFEQNGLDARVYCGNRTDVGCTPIDRFVDKMVELFPSMDGAPIYAADSHAYGLHAARDAWHEAGEKPVRVVHFDAHSDLGYHDAATMAGEVESGRYDCASWLFHALVLGFADEIVFVKPDWTSQKEVAHIATAEHLAPYRDRIRVVTWSEWVKSPESGNVVATNLARSGAWSPPWLDEMFQTKLLYGLPSYEIHCLDCDDSDPRDGAPHACTIREFTPLQWPVPSAP